MIIKQNFTIYVLAEYTKSWIDQITEPRACGTISSTVTIHALGMRSNGLMALIEPYDKSHIRCDSSNPQIQHSITPECDFSKSVIVQILHNKEFCCFENRKRLRYQGRLRRDSRPLEFGMARFPHSFL